MLEFCEGRRKLEVESARFEKVAGVCKAARVEQVQGIVGCSERIVSFVTKIFLEKKGRKGRS